MQSRSEHAALLDTDPNSSFDAVSLTFVLCIQGACEFLPVDSRSECGRETVYECMKI